jgi:hypothetical protein
MVLDPRKRQKKLERKREKQRAKSKGVARYGSHDIAARLERYAAAPILHCVAMEEIWTEGMGSVLISRQLSSGEVAFASFLVDIYCLGVKDTFYDIVPRHRYDSEMYGRMADGFELRSLRPECARKLVEGAVNYARDLGLTPHADYRKSRLIFGGIDAAACPEEFVYGRDGKPFYLAGPYDTLARSKSIIGLLTARCGENGFDYLLPLAAPEMLAELPGFIPSDDDSDDEDENER